jgi:hypothetical protein
MKEKQVVNKNSRKATNYILVIVLAGSILYAIVMTSRHIVNYYDFSTKNEFAMYILWCIVIAYLLYTNL